jgi:hypothetical protein
MRETYKILYRHMKIETPGPNSETYDCWVDGEASTVSVQLQGEYGPTGPIETMPLDDDVMLSRFGTATCTVIASLSTTIESDETEKADKNPRDTQFASSAIQLWEHLSSEIDWIMQGKGDVERIIANYAYDLVAHAMKYLDDHPSIEDCLSHPNEPISYIPDLTAWPEETNAKG